jgi:putative transposase
VDPARGARAYHCMSRTVNSEWLFEESDRERLRLLIWAVAEFCGVEVLTYAILSNHFHVLVKVSERTMIPAEEVVRRYAVLYPVPSRFRPELMEVICKEVSNGSDAGHRWLDKQRRQMGDISHYMKLLKQRFTVLFNMVHKRHGTLWSERFKSVLVEDGHALATMAAYIDLNPVRAGLVQDPKDYRYCGYAEAVAENVKAQRGYQEIVQKPDWEHASADYRIRLFGAACKPREKGETLEAQVFENVIHQRGKIPVHVMLQCRLRYLTDGAVLGSSAFVRAQLGIEKRKYGRVIALEPKKLPPISDWGGLTILRRPRAGICLSEPMNS